MVLDTTTNIMWHYKKATSNAWLRLNLLPSDTASMLTPYWRAGRFSGVLPVANGGTGASLFSPNNYLIRTNSSGIFDTSAVYEADGRVGIGTTTPSGKLNVLHTASTNIPALKIESSGTLANNDIIRFQVNGSTNGFRMFQNSSSVFNYTFEDGNVGIGTTNPSQKLDVNGTTKSIGYLSSGVNSFNSAYYSNNTADYTVFRSELNTARSWQMDNVGNDFKLFIDGSVDKYAFTLSATTDLASFTSLSGGTSNRAVLADVNGGLSAPVSSINYKENVQSLNYGLNEILQINPVSFNFIDKNKWGEGLDLGFIVEDMFPIIPEITGTINDGTMYLDMTKLIPILTKAMQEQQALIKALEQRIINLENK
jgi:hypothetical protein